MVVLSFVNTRTIENSFSVSIPVQEADQSGYFARVRIIFIESTRKRKKEKKEDREPICMSPEIKKEGTLAAYLVNDRTQYIKKILL